jgi:1-deoxy-D-xylulose-5-phosphate reductoisomerase
MNKGLEVIEANELFGAPAGADGVGIGFDEIDVVVHPQSIVHSMVEFVDGSTIAQASPPDMRLPISLGLDWPHRVAGVGAPLDWTRASRWDFEPLDERAFPSVALARQVGEAAGSYPAVFNAANEMAVEAFHDGAIAFPGIVDTIRRVLDAHRPESGAPSRASLLAADGWARRAAATLIAHGAGSGIPEPRRLR